MSDPYSLVCPIAPTDPRRALDLDPVAFRKFRAYELCPEQYLSTMERARPMTLLAMASPEAIPDRLRAVADLWLWEYAFDDHFFDGGQMHDDPAGACNLILPLLHLIESLDYAQPETGSWDAALLEIRTKMETLSSPGELDRWAALTRDMLVSFACEVSLGKAGARPGFRESLRLRMDTTGAKSYLSLIPYLNGYQLSDHELATPAVKAATQACCALLSIDNDLLSYDREKELEKGAMVNTVEALATKAAISPDEAAKKIITLRNHIMELYLRLRDTARPTASRELTHYIDNIGLWVRSNLDWSLSTPRYSAFGDTASFASQLQLVDTRSEPVGAAQGTGIWWWDLPGMDTL
ncbi:terpene synthase family protein [Corallococcus terminator]